MAVTPRAPDHVLWSKEHFSYPGKAVTSSLAYITSEAIINNARTTMTVEVSNTHASVDLTDFALYVKTHPDGDYVAYITGTAWATVANVLKYKSASINTLTHGVNAVAVIDISGVYGFRFMAQTGSAGTVSIYGTIQ